MMGWVAREARIGEMRSAYEVLVGKPEAKRPHRRPRSRWRIILNWFQVIRLGSCGWDSSASV